MFGGGYHSDFVSRVGIGSNAIAVTKDGIDATGRNGDLSKSFKTVPAAYTYAKGLNPGIGNRIQILLFDGIYADGSLNMDTPFIDLIYYKGAERLHSGIKEETFSNIQAKFADDKRAAFFNDTITVSADNLRIIGFNVESLLLTQNIPVVNFQNCHFESIYATSTIDIVGTPSGLLASWIDVHCDSFLPLAGTFSNIDGSFLRCTSGDNSFGSTTASFNLFFGSAKLLNTGNNSLGTIFIGNISDSVAGDDSLGTLAFVGNAENITTGARCFGGVAGFFIGAAKNCHGTIDCFGGSGGHSGLSVDCSVSPGQIGFGTNGTISGTMIRCSGVFGANSISTTAVFDDIDHSSIQPFCPGAVMDGLMVNTKMKINDVGIAITLGSNARIYDNIIINTGGGHTLGALSPVTPKIAHCKLRGGAGTGDSIDTTLITNQIITPFIIDDVNLEI